MSEAGRSDLRLMSRTMRRWIIERSFLSHVGHIGSALSIVEMIAALWGRVLRMQGTQKADRDRFILSKGHAALALYAALHYLGKIDAATFATYCGEGSLLGVHPDHALPGIDLSTGSLGQGLSVGCGLAYGLREQETKARVYVLMSDAECNEGQVWEAAQFAAQHRLGNLVGLIDANGTQALGRTEEILDLEPWTGRWQAFGWEAVDVDGHDPDTLARVLAQHSDRPRMVVARTTMGKGVEFMEGQVAWHYRVLNDSLRDRALAQLECN